MNPQLIVFLVGVAERAFQFAMQLKAQAGMTDEGLRTAAMETDAETRAQVESFIARVRAEQAAS
jgi:hypothetical protein